MELYITCKLTIVIRSRSVSMQQPANYPPKGYTTIQEVHHGVPARTHKSGRHPGPPLALDPPPLITTILRPMTKSMAQSQPLNKHVLLLLLLDILLIL